MSYSPRSNSETFTGKDYRAFADVKLPRLERVQHVPNEKLYKVKLLQRGDRVKIYLALLCHCFQASMGGVVLTVHQQQTLQAEVS